VKLHERLRDVLPQLMIADPQGSAVDPSMGGHGRLIDRGSGGHGKHGGTTAAPPQVNAVALEYAELFGRLLDMAEMDLAVLQGREKFQPHRVGSGGKVSNRVANDRRRRIVRSAVYTGRRAAFVAYVEGCSESLVQKVRAERGLDAHGLPVDKARPITAQARDMLAAHEGAR
jgi:hypothetical protein